MLFCTIIYYVMIIPQTNLYLILIPMYIIIDNMIHNTESESGIVESKYVLKLIDLHCETSQLNLSEPALNATFKPGPIHNPR